MTDGVPDGYAKIESGTSAPRGWRFPWLLPGTWREDLGGAHRVSPYEFTSLKQYVGGKSARCMTTVYCIIETPDGTRTYIKDVHHFAKVTRRNRWFMCEMLRGKIRNAYPAQEQVTK